jgi:hypothetical protein
MAQYADVNRQNSELSLINSSSFIKKFISHIEFYSGMGKLDIQQKV